MARTQRWLFIVCMIIACFGLAACGGDDGGTVTGDSPEGIPVDSPLEDEVVESDQAIQEGDGEQQADESLTDGQ